METPATRAMIHTCITDIPGLPQQRHTTLGELFCKKVLGREFHGKLQPACYDHVHIPADFDSELPLKRWFIIDLGVKQQLTTEAVSDIPHLVYLGTWQNDELIFIPREKWTQTAISRAGSYTWGGRLEQRQVAEMRERNTAD
ncbi:hypothetical protein BDW59DRAFT_137448 [Aspergillus cavernicola]|uniref:Uncharacterized protein n=1 Tax=Aspergillus cavernicola TaxID=176166 RepID=A0ABR4J2B5_9EURO